MLDKAKLAISHFSREKLEIKDDSTIAVVEADAGGKGTISFQVSMPSLHFKPGGQPFRWLKNQRCADGGFVLFHGDGDHELHVVELKSSMSLSEWHKVKDQFAGFVLNYRAAVGVMRATCCDKVTFYICFHNDSKMSAPKNQIIFKKTLVGRHTKLAGDADYHSGKLDILDLKDCLLIKIQRLPNGDATHVVG